MKEKITENLEMIPVNSCLCASLLFDYSIPPYQSAVQRRALAGPAALSVHDVVTPSLYVQMSSRTSETTGY